MILLLVCTLVYASIDEAISASPYAWTVVYDPGTRPTRLARAARAADNLGYTLVLDPVGQEIGLGHATRVYGMDCIAARFAATAQALEAVPPYDAFTLRVTYFIRHWDETACVADIWDAAHAPFTLALATLCYGPCLYYGLRVLWKNTDGV